jgi:hypothetical protein
MSEGKEHLLVLDGYQVNKYNELETSIEMWALFAS